MGIGADGTARSIAYPVGDTTRYRHSPELAEADVRAREIVSISQTNNSRGSK
jgi:hypothetical protein